LNVPIHIILLFWESKRDPIHGGWYRTFDQWVSSPTSPSSPKSLYDLCLDTPRHYTLLCHRFKRCFFFFIPLHPKSQHIFGLENFTRKGRLVTWTVLHWVFRNSSHLFGLALAQDLAEWKYPQTTLLQYVVDLFLFGPTEPAVSLATETLLNFIADKG
jgi:hypothetical protein